MIRLNLKLKNKCKEIVYYDVDYRIARHNSVMIVSLYYHIWNNNINYKFKSKKSILPEKVLCAAAEDPWIWSQIRVKE